jgi:ribose transport system permease protein
MSVDQPLEAIEEVSFSAPGRFQRLLLAISLRPVSAVVTAFVITVAIFSVLSPEYFPTLDNARTIALNASVVLVLATSATYVVIAGELDVSVGSVLVFAGVVSAKVMQAVGGNGVGVSLLGLAVALACGLAWGALNGILVTRARLSSIIVTLASLGSALGLARVLSTGQDFVDFPTSMTDFGSGTAFGVSHLVYVAAVVMLIGGVVLSRTRFGRFTKAIGSNVQAARRAGIPVERHVLVIFVLSGMSAGLAGWLSMARFSSTAIASHAQDTFNALTGVLLGGVGLFGGAGAMVGVLFGTLIPVVLDTGLVLVGVQSFWQQVAVGAVLVGAVYVDRLRRERAE